MLRLLRVSFIAAAILVVVNLLVSVRSAQAAEWTGPRCIHNDYSQREELGGNYYITHFKDYQYGAYPTSNPFQHFHYYIITNTTYLRTGAGDIVINRSNTFWTEVCVI